MNGASVPAKMAWPVRPWLIGMTDRQQPFAAPVGNCKNSTEHLQVANKVLIAEGKGSNDLVEKKRGKKFRNLDMPIEFLQTPLAPEQQSVATNNGTNDQPYDLVQDEEDSDEE